MDSQPISRRQKEPNPRQEHHTRMMEKIPKGEMWKLRGETHKALVMSGIKMERYLEDLDKKDAELIDSMMPFTLDNGSMYPLKPLLPLPEKYNRAKETLEYDNSELPPIPILSAAVAPYILAQSGTIARSVDGTGIYGHNEVAGLEGDRAIRKLLTTFTHNISNLPSNSVIRWKGDLFLVVHDEVIDKLGEKKFSSVVREATIRTEEPDRYLNSAEQNRLASFSLTDKGIVLDTARMHYTEDEVKKEDVAKKIERGPVRARITTLESLHPELKSLIQLIKQKPEKERSTLIGIIEGKLYDPLLQPIINSINKEGFELRAYMDAQDIQYHLQANNSALTKLEIASTLKTINSEGGFGEIAGDAFLCAIYKKVVQEVQQQIPELKQLTTLRRWGDYYFVEDKDTSKKIGQILLKTFQEAKYAKISRKNDLNQLDSYNVEFVRTPPAMNSDELLIPVLPIIGIDEGIKLYPIESGTDDNTAAALRLSNEMIFSARMKTLDEEVKKLRPRLILERLENPKTEDIEMILFHILNPIDPKRGIPRLRNIFKATDEDMRTLTKYVEMINSGLQTTNKSSLRERVIAMEQNSGVTQRVVLETLLKLSGEIVQYEDYFHRHNEVSVYTGEMVNATFEEEIDNVMKRLGSY